MATKSTPSRARAESERRTTQVRKVRPGYISHTELASRDPKATKAFCQKVLGWEFTQTMPTPTGDYHLFRFEEMNGGGIRNTNPGEPPMAIPYVEVDDIKSAEADARRAGGKTIMPITQIPDGGNIFVVEAPGGVAIGFWAPK